MNFINAILLVVLGAIIFGSVYFIKQEAESKKANNSSYPIFMSLRYSETNLRSGPSRDYPVIHTYTQSKIPIKVIRKHTGWYEVSDINNNSGWIAESLLSSKKTVISIQDEIPIYQRSTNKSKNVAIVNKFFILEVVKCDDSSLYCKFNFEYNNNEFSGWALKHAFWGGID